VRERRHHHHINDCKEEHRLIMMMLIIELKVIIIDTRASCRLGGVVMNFLGDAASSSSCVFFLSSFLFSGRNKEHGITQELLGSTWTDKPHGFFGSCLLRLFTLSSHLSLTSYNLGITTMYTNQRMRVPERQASATI